MSSEFMHDGSIWVCGEYRIVPVGASWRLRKEGTDLDLRFADWNRAAERASAMMAADGAGEAGAEPVDVVDDEDGDEPNSGTDG